MKRHLNISDPEDQQVLAKRVSLVERTTSPRGVQLVDSSKIAKKAPDDIVELALELQKADTFIRATTCNKLQTIAEQVQFLLKQAQNVLLDAKKNTELHHAACNFKKVVGNVYFLYKRASGQNYFSMLSPEEWQSCPHEFLGGFRLEADQSWTPTDCIESKNSELCVINKILKAGEKSLSQALETAMEI